MRYLFWNTNGNNKRKDNTTNNNAVLIEIVNKYSCDFIALVEYNKDLRDLLNELNKIGEKKYYLFEYVGFKDTDRIKIITTYDSKDINLYYDEGYFKIFSLKHDSLGKQLITVVHLPSKYKDEYGAKCLALRLKPEIEKYEEISEIANTIVLGDFNMNPFDEGMVASYGLHAIASKDDALKDERGVYYKKFKMFYNPMWSFLGEYSKARGSYYYSGGCFCYFWNTFDQVIIRPNLINYLKENTMEILSEINGINLCKDNGRPNDEKYSDHLPLFFEIS